MEYLVGVMLGLGVGALGALAGLDRDRAFYPTALIVIAAYYVLFAAMGASGSVLAIEIAVGIGFSLAALVGFKKNMWLVAAAIAGHGIFDFIHPVLYANPGVPVWWPGFCGSVDVVLGTWLALRLYQVRTRMGVTGASA
jgi:hypothetical protein